MQGSVLLVISLFFISVLSPISGIAADLSWRPRVETGALYYKFDDENALRVRQNTLFAQEGIEIESWLPFVGGGVTVFVDRFFIDGNVQYAFEGSDRFAQSLGSAGATTPLTTEFTSNDSDIKRLEYALSLGYSVAEETALYLGVKGARTEFDVNSTGEQFSAGSSAGTFNQILDLEFSYIGPFVGGTQAWNLDKGSFTANVGVAFLWSTFEQTVDGVGQPDIDGNTIGLNFGVSWIGLTPVDQLTYTLGIKGYRYDFEADEADVGDTKETAVTFAAGLAYAF